MSHYFSQSAVARTSTLCTRRRISTASPQVSTSFIDYLPYSPLRHGSIRVGVLWTEVLGVLSHVRPRLHLAPIEGEDRGHS